MKVMEAYIMQNHGFQTTNDFLLTVLHQGSEGEPFWSWFKLQVRQQLGKEACMTLKHWM